ncbi:carboxypeptidase Q-like [Halichondria panicea]|uniref:carboxypeptidase Q-like n=1 Tax=Halichondria panicea TaxID=6063 RepID=UPI00312B91C6
MTGLPLSFVLLSLLLVIAAHGHATPKSKLPSLPSKIVQEIQSYQPIADQIIKYSLTGLGQNQSYDRLSVFTDKFGGRLSGTKNLEDSIDYMLDALQKDGLDNVHGEVVNVTHWERNTEYATLLEPRVKDIAISGLGSSVGTGADGITADVIVVRSFDDLDAHASDVSGKIVVFNQKYVSYPATAGYRVIGASKASKYGAVATLIRSVTPQSIYSPHTGIQDYVGNVKKIPTACITVEDAEFFDRIQSRGEPIRIKLYMGAVNYDMSLSRNTVAEIKGSVFPKQTVLVSGHLDSWDVGEGAMDDGGGAFISWQALSIIRSLGLKPKRTVRLVMWTDEEAGGVGSQQYYQKHRDEANNISILFESDEGVFTPYGMLFTGSPKAKAVMAQIGKLLQAVNSSEVYDNGGGTDVQWWRKDGVPTASIANHSEKYFWFHHSNGDTMTVLDPVEMNMCSAVWAVYAYVLADMDELLPRD